MITLPTLSELYNSILASLESEFEGVIDADSKSALRAQAATQAGKMKQYYLAIASLQKNIFVDTCDIETLLRFGKIKLGRYPFQPTAGVYTVQVTGTIGAIIKAQTTFKSDDDSKNPGVLFILSDAYVLVSTTDSIAVRCLTLGIDGKLDIGDTLTATAPIALVSKIGTVLSEDTQPLDGEDVETDYREKVLNSYRLEAQGGASADYRIWSADAQGVRKVYAYAKSGSVMEVDLFIEATAADSTDGKGTPSAQTLLDVEDVVNFNPDTTLTLNERGRRPVGVIPNYLPVTIKTIVITVTGFQDLDATIQADLLTAFTNSINTIRPFVAAADILSEKNDIIDTNKLIGVIVSTKPGAVFTSATFTVDAAPLSSYTFTQGNIPWLNPVIVFN